MPETLHQINTKDMSSTLAPVERVRGLDRKTFVNEFIKPGRPVVLEDYAENWPAKNKWTFDYFRQVAGANVVPLYDNSKVDYTKKVNEPIATMTLSEYLDILQKEPTELRIFLYNIFSHAPELCGDFSVPDFAPNVLSRFPMMFFGGANSRVFMHFDIDMSHVFHTHFAGRKKAILFDYKYGDLLYRVPFAVHSNEDIDIENPDVDKWPGLKHVQGYEADLGHGDTLFMPSGMWHYMKYLDGSYSLSLRALNSSPLTKLKGVYNVIVMRQIDNLARKIGGQGWIDYKDRWSIQRAARAALNMR
jgi:hypothetical protein